MLRTVVAMVGAGVAAANPADVYSVLYQTSAGNVTVEVHPAWAPRGAERFTQLIHDVGARQRPTRNTYAPIPDDPSANVSNTIGTVSFATSGKDTRTTQLFVNFRDNSRLDALGFTPFAVVTSGLDVLVNDVYSGYREQPQQPKIKAEGEAYLAREFPLLTHIHAASIASPSVLG